MAKWLYVGSLPATVDVDDLLVLFGQAGAVLSVTRVRHPDTGEHTGFAWVEMASDEDAENAIRMFDGLALDEHEIRVTAPIEHPMGGDEEPGSAY